MLKIADLNKLKFTSVKQCDCIIHFRYDGEDYTLVKKLDSDGNVTKKFALYKGRCKGKLELIAEAEGDTNYLIEYLYFRVNLKTIDKENFVRILQCYGLVDYEANRYKLTKSELAIFHRAIRNEEFYKSMRNYGMFRYIPSDMPIEKCLADCEVIKDPDRIGTRAIYMWFRN